MSPGPSVAGSGSLPLLTLLALCGCVTRPPAATVVKVTPVDVTTTYIEAYVHHFARGQFAIVSVCVAADGVIAEVRVVESSTDKAFDEAALVWARQARYRPQLTNGQPVYGCREVRVEINPDPAPRITRGADSALG
ncbi:MAG TPA: TonB family protein [Steroidobacteraceae bacterium]|nr:TonB family protein [Steroidobacteraceae bacterium]